MCTTSTIAVAIVDWLLPGQIADTVWTVSCDGTFVVQYLNDFGGEFIISIDGKEESRVSGEHTTLTKTSFSANTTVSMTASVKSHGNKKVLFSWACDAMPAALPSTLNTAGDVSHMKYGPSELVYWTLQCKEHRRRAHHLDVFQHWQRLSVDEGPAHLLQRDRFGHC